MPLIGDPLIGDPSVGAETADAKAPRPTIDSDWVVTRAYARRDVWTPRRARRSERSARRAATGVLRNWRVRPRCLPSGRRTPCGARQLLSPGRKAFGRAPSRSPPHLSAAWRAVRCANRCPPRSAGVDPDRLVPGDGARRHGLGRTRRMNVEPTEIRGSGRGRVPGAWRRHSPVRRGPQGPTTTRPNRPPRR